MRRSPGSNLSITSPRATRSQRLPSLFLIFSGMVSFSISQRDRLETRREKLHDQERDQIHGTGDDEHGKVSSAFLQYPAGKRRDEQATEGAAKPTDAHYGAHSALGKHV